MTRWWIIVACCASGWAQWSAPPFPPDSVTVKSSDVRELLGLLCPGQEYVGQESGCRVCPPVTGAAGAKSDSVIESTIEGHFLKPDSDDLLLVLYGCSSRERSFRDVFLFTRSSTGWFVNQASGLPAGRCHKIRSRDGRDALVCFSDTTSPEQSTASLTFGHPGESQMEMARAFDNTGGACDAPNRPVVQSALQQVSFVPDKSGKLTIRVLARCRRGPLSPRSRKACAAGPGFEDIGPSVATRAFRMDYTFNGETLSLAPYSQAAKKSYDACSAAGK